MASSPAEKHKCNSEFHMSIEVACHAIQARCESTSYRGEIDLKVGHVVGEQLVIRLEELHLALAKADAIMQSTPHSKHGKTLGYACKYVAMQTLQSTYFGANVAGMIVPVSHRRFLIFSVRSYLHITRMSNEQILAPHTGTVCTMTMREHHTKEKTRLTNRPRGTACCAAGTDGSR